MDMYLNTPYYTWITMTLWYFLSLVAIFLVFGWFSLPNSACSNHHLSFVCVDRVFDIWHICPIWWAYLFLVHILQHNVKKKVQLIVFWHILCRNIGSIHPFIMLFLGVLCQMWQPYLFNDICQIFVQCSLLSGCSKWFSMWYMYVHTSSTYAYYFIWHIFRIWCTHQVGLM